MYARGEKSPTTGKHGRGSAAASTQRPFADRTYWTRTKMRVLELVLGNNKVDQVAAEVKVSPARIYQIMREPTFAAELAAAHEDRIRAARMRLIARAEDVAENLTTLALTGEKMQFVQVVASKEVLGLLRVQLPEQTAAPESELGRLTDEQLEDRIMDEAKRIETVRSGGA